MRFTPFISTVTTDLNPIGLPPIRSDLFSSTIGMNKKPKENPIDKKNRIIIKKIQKIKQIEKEKKNLEIKKQLRMLLKSKEKQSKNTKQQDKMIMEYNNSKDAVLIKNPPEIPQSIAYNNTNDATKETTRKTEFSNEEKEQVLKKRNECFEAKDNNNIDKTNNNLSNSLVNNNREKSNFCNDNTNQANKEVIATNCNNQNPMRAMDDLIRNNPKYQQFKEKLDNIEQKEADDLLEFAKSLDFEKYLKDLEIREALNLIKLKVDEDKRLQLENNQCPTEEEKGNNSKLDEQAKLDDNNQEKSKSKNELILPQIENNNIKADINENTKDWGVSK